MFGCDNSIWLKKTYSNFVQTELLLQCYTRSAAHEHSKIEHAYKRILISLQRLAVPNNVPSSVVFHPMFTFCKNISICRWTFEALLSRCIGEPGISYLVLMHFSMYSWNIENRMYRDSLSHKLDQLPQVQHLSLDQTTRAAKINTKISSPASGS